MAVKKSQIYSSLWQSCDKLRGGMDASQYKDYILVLLFVKYVSDRYAGDPNAVIVVPEGGSFADMVKLRGDKEIGDRINKIIAKLAEANGLKGVIDVANFNDPDKLGDGKEMIDRLSDLIAIFDRPELNFRKNRADGDDILGDAYEYLMRHFATESGKSKGQFYTPAEVSRIIAKVIGIRHAKSVSQTLYDPTCGSGSLLLKARSESPVGITVYGQEKDVATRALAKMNMVLHDCPDADIVRDNTLSSPYFREKDQSLKRFDFVVANPPFSDKAWTTGVSLGSDDPDGRFEYGTPPAKNGDYAYLLHVIASLKSTGKGAIILPHGVLFRGNAEAEIRKNIIAKGFIKGIIGLPANLFYGTGIPACIIVLDKENADRRTGIFMIDASKGFVKDGNKNRLRAQDIHKIVDAFTKQIEIEKFSRLVPLSEIVKNDFNLNIPRYIDSSEPEDLQDIAAHLLGGIPERDVDALSSYWGVLPDLRRELFGPGPRPGACAPKVEASGVKPAILEHKDFGRFSATVLEAFASWRRQHAERLKGLSAEDHPKQVIEVIAEDLLARFATIPILDAYDIYQHLMSFWEETMHDDASLIVQDRWEAGRTLRELHKNSEGKFTETPDLAIGKKRLKAELIPPNLIVARFFADKLADVEAKEAAAEELRRAFEELDEEQGGEDGLLFEGKNEKGKLTAAGIKARLKDIRRDPEAAEEREALEKCLRLIEEEAEASRAAKEARLALDVKTAAKYPALTEAEIKALIVDDKWMAALDRDIHGELDRVGQTLAGRIKLLAERYAAPLPQLAEEAEAIGARVEEHLRKMGFAWRREALKTAAE
ncbi:type I restriction-modification system, M subunit [Rhodomicrobium vannielii ATCC 17100]|uniref:site-specific DNA-methyltransferase (adenine-specific) n=1 Tax=Rhodomicrobium vannielii (strain ATCC 17100 / DSM 162 / LMG 4299 / NCIMB 10020 / ATH 3.1.1) TaxID=648757 RepID=E3I8R5_RHOVT|nr:type I restriction-modification system subunit M [Rhodomicrobium vannielii]ADP72044.1 type I restriction-modification system, M subunit [Rhodomicrobium vannielii ATCC 17100]